MSATSFSRLRHDGQGASPRATTRALQARFKIRQVTLRLESEERPGAGY